MKFYSNKTKKGYSFNVADPFIYRWKGNYYMFSTGDYCPIHTSKDLISWTYVGTAIAPDENNEDIKNCYAPEVIYTSGKFYLTFSPDGNEHRLYSSERLTGDYTLCTDAHYAGIDGSFYPDKNNEIHVFRSGDVRGAEGDGIFYATMRHPEYFPTAKWKKVPSAHLDGWTEGPFMFTRGGYDYLIFTGNHYLSNGYRLSYCYKKREDPIENYEFGGTFLISAEDDFCGLGHASVVTAPNLDGLVLSFHNLAKPHHPKRHANFTTLTTNGKYLFCNGLATYPTPVFEKPLFECAGREGLVLADNRFSLPVDLSKNFTCEFTFYCTPPVDIYLGSFTLTVDEGHCYLKNIEHHKHAQYNFIQKKNSYVVRIENGKTLNIFVNGQQVFCEPSLRRNYVALSNEIIPEYTAVSNHVDGSSDKALIKNVPSRFPCRACEEIVTTKLIDNAYYVDGKQDLTYNLNVSKSGNYAVIVNSKTAKKALIEVKVGEEEFKGIIPDGTKRENVLTIPLKKGLQKITVNATCPICDIELKLIKKPKYARLNKHNANILHGKFEINGKIQARGYSVLRLDGENFDYATTFSTDVTAKEYRGGVMIRANDYSYFDNQQKESYIGYLVSVYDGRIHLFKTEYNKKEIFSIPLLIKTQTADIKVDCVGARIDFYVNGEFYDSYTDDNAIFSGFSGILSVSDKLNVYALKTQPHNKND